MSEGHDRTYDNLISINILIIFVQHDQGKYVSTSNFFGQNQI